MTQWEVNGRSMPTFGRKFCAAAVDLSTDHNPSFFDSPACLAQPSPPHGSVEDISKDASSSSIYLNEKDDESISLPKVHSETNYFDDPFPLDPTSTPDPSYHPHGIVCNNPNNRSDYDGDTRTGVCIFFPYWTWQNAHNPQASRAFGAPCLPCILTPPSAARGVLVEQTMF